MLKHMLAITMVVAAASLVTPGIGSAEVACNPLCAAQSSNSGGTDKGLNRANQVAVDHGAQGRANAQQKQDAHKPGGSGVTTSGGDTGGTTGGTDTGGSTGGTDTGGGPCTGC